MLNYSEAINYIKDGGYTKIFVTGSPRSGTRIATRMIAEELDYFYWQEEEIGIDNLRIANSRANNEYFGVTTVDFTGFALQCPALCAAIPQLIVDEKCLIIFMIRPFADIFASFKRLNWGDGNKQLNKQIKAFRSLPFHGMFGPTMLLPEMARMAWKERYKDEIGKQGIELDYNSLAENPLWIEKEKRIGWNARMTGPITPGQNSRYEKIRLLCKKQSPDALAEAIMILSRELNERKAF